MYDGMGSAAATPRVIEVQAVVGESRGFTVPELISPCRKKNLAHARMFAYLLARDLTGASYPAIGVKFRRDHSSVLYGVRRYRAIIAQEPSLAEEYERCAERIRLIASTRTEDEAQQAERLIVAIEMRPFAEPDLVAVLPPETSSTIWTSADLRLLKQLWGANSDKTIARVLGNRHSLLAIRGKAISLGLVNAPRTQRELADWKALGGELEAAA